MIKTLKDISLISFIYLSFRLFLYNFTSIDQFIQITSSALVAAGLVVRYLIKLDASIEQSSILSLAYFPTVSGIFSKKDEKTVLKKFFLTLIFKFLWNTKF